MWKHWLLRIGLSPLLHRSWNLQYKFNIRVVICEVLWPALRQTAKGSCDLLVCRVRLHLGGYLPWLLTLSRQGICCLNSVQDLQNYDLYKCFSPSSSLKLVSQKGYQLSIFSRAIGHLVTKILAYIECALSHHRPRAAGYLTPDLLVNR